MDLSLIRQVMHDLKIRSTRPQFTRTHADKIYQILSYFGVEGDL